jgi:hypothetical protein
VKNGDVRMIAEWYKYDFLGVSGVDFRLCEISIGLFENEIMSNTRLSVLSFLKVQED